MSGCDAVFKSELLTEAAALPVCTSEVRVNCNVLSLPSYAAYLASM
jgi:hypothetical protein